MLDTCEQHILCVFGVEMENEYKPRMVFLLNFSYHATPIFSAKAFIIICLYENLCMTPPQLNSWKKRRSEVKKNLLSEWKVCMRNILFASSTFLTWTYFFYTLQMFYVTIFCFSSFGFCVKPFLCCEICVWWVEYAIILSAYLKYEWGFKKETLTVLMLKPGFSASLDGFVPIIQKFELITASIENTTKWKTRKEVFFVSNRSWKYQVDSFFITQQHTWIKIKKYSFVYIALFKRCNVLIQKEIICVISCLIHDCEFFPTINYFILCGLDTYLRDLCKKKKEKKKSKQYESAYRQFYTTLMYAYENNMVFHHSTISLLLFVFIAFYIFRPKQNNFISTWISGFLHIFLFCFV